MSYYDNEEPNKGIGDYVIVTFLAAVMSFFHFGFGWFGLKIILSTALLVTMYAILVYFVEWLAEKFNQ